MKVVRPELVVLMLTCNILLLDLSQENFSCVFYWLTKYKPFSYYGKQFLFHYDNRNYWSFWEKIVKDWYQIWIKGWEQDNYFVYFYCGLNNPRRKGRIEEVQMQIDKRVGEGIVKVGLYENQRLTLRIPKSYFK